MQLSEIQAQLKVPKAQTNTFAKYNFRSAEDIIEAVKLIINPLGFALILDDEIVMIGNRYYVKSIAAISDGKTTHSATGWAREEETKKGMDTAQITGSASSYARKYALNGLFAIDDTKDPDATNTHGKEEMKTEFKKPQITDDQFTKARGFVVDKKTYDSVCSKYFLTSRQDEILFNQIKK